MISTIFLLRRLFDSQELAFSTRHWIKWVDAFSGPFIAYLENGAFLKDVFVFLFLAVLGLGCCTQAFSSCGERGLLSSCRGQVAHCCGSCCCRAAALGTWVSVLVARGLRGCGSRALEHRLSSRAARLSCSVACGIVPAGIGPVSLALQSSFLTTGPPGNPHNVAF